MRVLFSFTLFWQSGQPQGPSGSVPRAASHTTIAACSSQGFQDHLVWMGLKYGKGWGEERKKKTQKKPKKMKNKNLFLGNRKYFDWTCVDEIWKAKWAKCFVYSAVLDLNHPGIWPQATDRQWLVAVEVRVSFLTSSNFILPRSGLSHGLDPHGLWHDPDSP